jgi:hypothetical protein
MGSERLEPSCDPRSRLFQRQRALIDRDNRVEDQIRLVLM